MTRSQLVEVVYQRHGGISRREAQALVDVIFRLIRTRLVAGERVEISGLGSFAVEPARAREGRHPVTGRPFRTVAGRSLVFRASRVLKESLNEVPA
jgi:nucleoid DNA-binding protein